MVDCGKLSQFLFLNVTLIAMGASMMCVFNVHFACLQVTSTPLVVIITGRLFKERSANSDTAVLLWEAVHAATHAPILPIYVICALLLQSQSRLVSSYLRSAIAHREQIGLVCMW